MKNGKIAVPSSNPGGLESAVGAHFGHCELYTIIDIEDGKISNVETLPNIPHQQGGCMAPVNYLHEHGVTFPRNTPAGAIITTTDPVQADHKYQKNCLPDQKKEWGKWLPAP